MAGIRKKMDPEAIHQIRVEYKKLRAFLRMLSSSPSVTHEINVPKKLKRLYSVCGEIRDLQLQQEQIKEIRKDIPGKAHPYQKALKRQIDHLTSKLHALLDKKPATSGKRKTMRDIPDLFTVQDFKRYTRRQWTSVRSILHSKNRTDDDLHTIRKWMKDLFYNLKICNGADLRLLQKSALKNMDESMISSLLDELGDFQDRSTALSLLNNYWLNRFNLPAHQFLCEVQHSWTKDQDRRRRLLNKKLKDIRIT